MLSHLVYWPLVRTNMAFSATTIDFSSFFDLPRKAPPAPISFPQILLWMTKQGFNFQTNIFQYFFNDDIHACGRYAARFFPHGLSTRGVALLPQNKRFPTPAAIDRAVQQDMRAVAISNESLQLSEFSVRECSWFNICRYVTYARH